MEGKTERDMITDYRLCNKNTCQKTHCARHANNRSGFYESSDLESYTILGHCDNYVSKSLLSLKNRQEFNINK